MDDLQLRASMDSKCWPGSWLKLTAFPRASRRVGQGYDRAETDRGGTDWCLGLPLDSPSGKTRKIEFTPPKGLGAVSGACGSAIHSPSTTRRYSYVPGGKVSSLAQRPFPRAIMSVALGCQSLNVPAMQTLNAVVCVNSMRTNGVLGIRALVRPDALDRRDVVVIVLLSFSPGSTS